MSGSRLILVADDTRLAAALQQQLGRELHQPVTACGFASVRQQFGRDGDGLILLMVTCPADAEATLRMVQEIYLQRLPVILFVLDANADARESLERLDPYVARRLIWPESADELIGHLRDRLGPARSGKPRPQTIEESLGRRLAFQTPSLLPLVERIALAATHDVTVLLTGETGTGKTYLANLLHEFSPRKGKPFLTVPCGALTSNLVESTFFGHVKGAFTGATENKIGKFEAAGTGTLLLDEIDTLGLEQQASLLRVIETGEFEPVGSNETRRCTARVVVASNWDLETAVRQGRFREDLYYRLNVMSFHLPPLRERIQDVMPLVRAIVARFNTRHRKDLFEISPEAMDFLESYPWPGNIRQLDNILHQAVLMSSGPLLLAEHLPSCVREPLQVAPVNRFVVAAAAPPTSPSLVHSREQTERLAIQRALASHGNSRSRTAAALGISRVTLYKKMKKYGLMDDAPVDGVDQVRGA
jgi:two-component system, NtrC family, response regulator HydG